MKTLKVEDIKVATDETVAKTTDEELRDELKVKKKQLEEHEARLHGKESKALGRKYLAIGEEIEARTRELEMRKIQIAKDAPLHPNFMFESDEKWREHKRWFDTKSMENIKTVLENLNEQKTKIEKEIPELKARIEVLEEQTKALPEIERVVQQ